MDEDSRCQTDYRSPRLKAGTDSSLMSFIKHTRDGFPLPSPLALSRLHLSGNGRWPYVTTFAPSAFQWLKCRQLDLHRLQAEASERRQQLIAFAAQQRQSKHRSESPRGAMMSWIPSKSVVRGSQVGALGSSSQGYLLQTPAVHAHKGCIYSYPENRWEENISAGVLSKNYTWKKSLASFDLNISVCAYWLYTGDEEIVSMSIHGKHCFCWTRSQCRCIYLMLVEVTCR